jgi:hypothetical protein
MSEFFDHLFGLEGAATGIMEDEDMEQAHLALLLSGQLYRLGRDLVGQGLTFHATSPHRQKRKGSFVDKTCYTIGFGPDGRPAIHDYSTRTIQETLDDDGEEPPPGRRYSLESRKTVAGPSGPQPVFSASWGDPGVEIFLRRFAGNFFEPPPFLLGLILQTGIRIGREIDAFERRDLADQIAELRAVKRVMSGPVGLPA